MSFHIYVVISSCTSSCSCEVVALFYSLPQPRHSTASQASPGVKRPERGSAARKIQEKK